MTEVVQAASWWVTALAFLVGSLALVSTRAMRPSLALFLELLLAAGLLRLSAESSWSVLGTAAATVAVRKLIAAQLPGRPTGAPAGAPTSSATP